MNDTTRLEWGLICDRSEYGLGRMLLRSSYFREAIDPEYDCWLNRPHRHEVVVRTVTMSEWEPVQGIGNYVPVPPESVECCRSGRCEVCTPEYVWGEE